MPIPESPIRIAMWSGPRNISTALMRSWGNRPDTFVCDEPLYAHYLQQTRLDHPGADEVIVHHESDWRKVINGLLGPVPGGDAIFYQKQMAHHLLPQIDRGWLDRVTNAFLIREPREMLTSLAKILPSPRLEDTGLPQQVEIFERVREQTGRVPPVIDARDVLKDPRVPSVPSAKRWGSPSTSPCSPGPPGVARRTASGRSTGTAASRRQRRSSPIGPSRRGSRSLWRKSSANAKSLMGSCISIDCEPDCESAGVADPPEMKS